MQASAIAQEALVARVAPVAPVLAPAEPIALAVIIFRAVAQETGMPSEVVRGDSMGPTHAATAIVAPPAWDLAVAASIAGVVASIVAAGASVVVVEVVVVEAEVAAVVADKCCESLYENHRSTDMKSILANT